ncbi:MAG: type IV pilus modification PilV family protein, partial [Planctomycetota bacterium]
MRSNTHGFTILEVTVATVVFGLALALIGGALTGSLRSSAEIYVVSEGSQAAEGVSNSIVQRLRGGAVLTSIGATELAYRVPVVVDDER